MKERRIIRGEAPRGKAHASEYLLSGIAKCGHCGGPMVGKAGYSYKGKQYRNYYCSRATKSKALCSIYNGHTASKLEQAILDHLGEFSDPFKVRQYLALAEKQDTEKYEVELKSVEKRLTELELQFLNELDGLLKRKVITEQEFASEDLIKRIPIAIKTFEEAFNNLEPRQQKAQLQTILKSAHIYKDGKIELEFRG